MKLSTHSLKKAIETQNKNIVTLVVDSVLRLWAFVTLVGVVTFVVDKNGRFLILLTDFNKHS